METNISVIILAAGNSSRLGKPKFLLKTSSGETFIETITRQYAEFGCANIIVVVNKSGNKLLTNLKFPSNTKIAINHDHNSGRFSSIKTGVEQINTNHTFIHNIDNPSAKAKILESLYNEKYQADVIKPVINNKGGHPILISKKVCEDIILEKTNDKNLKYFLKNYSTEEVEVNDDAILFNINTLEDYYLFCTNKKNDSMM